MADFSYTAEATINASADKVFGIVSDPTKHGELAGSDEIKKITVSPGPVGVGTTMNAEETVIVGGDAMDLTAESTVVTYEPGKAFSFTVNPALPEWVGRMQWSFDLAPDDSGTKVTHRVEIDWGPITHEMLIGLRDNYEEIRAPYVRDGMDKTLVNLKKMAEG
jgi:uncharacterized protein YndB with AHSA1/START domain